MAICLMLHFSMPKMTSYYALQPCFPIVKLHEIDGSCLVYDSTKAGTFFGEILSVSLHAISNEKYPAKCQMSRLNKSKSTASFFLDTTQRFNTGAGMFLSFTFNFS